MMLFHGQVTVVVVKLYTAIHTSDISQQESSSRQQRSLRSRNDRVVMMTVVSRDSIPRMILFLFRQPSQTSNGLNMPQRQTYLLTLTRQPRKSKSTAPFRSYPYFKEPRRKTQKNTLIPEFIPTAASPPCAPASIHPCTSPTASPTPQRTQHEPSSRTPHRAHQPQILQP